MLHPCVLAATSFADISKQFVLNHFEKILKSGAAVNHDILCTGVKIKTTILKDLVHFVKRFAIFC